MRALLLLLALALSAPLYGQSPAFVHDAMLDSINNNLGQIDADIRAGMGGDTASNIQYRGGTLLSNWSRGTLVLSNGFDKRSPMTELDVNATFSYSNGTNRWTNSTGFGAALSNMLTASWGTNFTLGTTAPGDTTVDGVVSNRAGSSWSIPVPVAVVGSGLSYTNVAFDLSMTGIFKVVPESFFLSVRGLVLSIVWAGFFMMLYDYVLKHMGETLNQRQVEGSKQEFFGFNASSVLGLGAACLITTLLVTALGIVLQLSCYGVFSSAGGTSSTVGVFKLLPSVRSFVQSVPSYEVVSSMLPIYGMLSIWVYYFIATRLMVLPIFYFVRGVILWIAV